MSEQIAIYQLTDEQRLEAKEQARNLVRQKIGERPTMEMFQDEMPGLPDRRDYEHHTVSEYPAWLVS